jgi:hypothetical protein
MAEAAIKTAEHHRELDDTKIEAVKTIKQAGDFFLALLAPLPGRETALARTKIEEAVMWAVKGVTA